MCIRLIPLFALAISCAATAPMPDVAAVAPGAAQAPLPPLVVGELEGLGLFQNEQREAEELIAAWARARGLPLMPLEEKRRIFSRAAEGKNAGTGEACGRPLSEWDAADRYLGGKGQLRSWVGCEEDGGCGLNVWVSDRIGFGDVRLRFAAPLEIALPWRRALQEALVSLAPIPEDESKGGFGLLGGMSGTAPAVAKPESLAYSAWFARADQERTKLVGEDAIRFANGHGALRACFGDTQKGTELLLAIAPDGAIGPCESSGLADETSACACAAFQLHASGEGRSRGERALIGIHFSPADLLSAGNAVITASVGPVFEVYTDEDGEKRYRAKVSDPSVSDWRAPSGDRVEACFRDETESGEQKAWAHLTFDAVGRPSEVRMQLPEGVEWPAARLACVRQAFLEDSRSPCPARAGLVAQAYITVLLRELATKKDPAEAK